MMFEGTIYLKYPCFVLGGYFWFVGVFKFITDCRFEFIFQCLFSVLNLTPVCSTVAWKLEEKVL